MPTATSFSWLFPWEQVVGGFNSFIHMLNTPLALSVALILVFAVATFIVSVVHKANQERAVDEALASGEVMERFDALPKYSDDEPDWDDYTEEEHREFARDFLFGQDSWWEED